MRPPADDADRLISTLAATYGLNVVQTQRLEPDGTVTHVVEAAGGGHRFQVAHETRMGAALELARLVGFDVTDS